MAQPAFGLLLQRLREERRLSLRELGQLAEIDHAYIYRLENGQKESPSEEALTKLIRALKAPKREAEMLRYLATHIRVDPGPRRTRSDRHDHNDRRIQCRRGYGVPRNGQAGSRKACRTDPEEF